MPTDRLAVATWNVRVGGGDLTAFIEHLSAGHLTGGTPPDHWAVLLQEAHRVGDDHDAILAPAPGESVQVLRHAPDSGERLDVIEVARRVGANVVYAPAVPNVRPDMAGPPEDRGVAIVSSLDLGEIGAVELPLERQPRVALKGTVGGVRSDGRPWALTLVSAHLENRTPFSRFFDSFGSARSRQARWLAASLDEGPVVLGGDLNTWAPSIMESAEEILRDALPDGPVQEEPTYATGPLRRRLDHLFFRLPDDATIRHIEVIPNRYGSDHHPVVAVVDLLDR